MSTSRLLLGVIVLASGAAVRAAPDPSLGPTPYSRTGPLEIRPVALDSKSIPRYGKLELTPDFSATYDNPFDPEDIAVDARIRCPSGRQMSVPGFLYRAYNRRQSGGQEVLTPAGEGRWRIRFTPVELGEHSLTVRVKDRSGAVESSPVRFQAVGSSSPGFVRLAREDQRYFSFDNGQAYYPIGANVCWSGRGTVEYDAWFPRYAQAGCNYARLWLSPHWSTFALERPGKRAEGQGLGQYDLGNAWRIDYVLDQAASLGLRLMLCIDSYNILREKDGYPQWASTPHNRANGGPLERPTDFWSNATIDRLYLNKLRYLVARYGYSTGVLSWEFWNEVDITTGYKTGPSREWHMKMATALRAMDPFHHLVTTSFANTPGDREVDLLPQLDYVQTHHYNNPDLVVTLANAHARKAAYGKPHIVGEIGADSGGPRTKDDPTGLQVHDPMWISLATGMAGTAQPWWWDSLIHPRDLYPLFGAAVRFARDIQWPREQFAPAQIRLDWAVPPSSAAREDLVLGEGPVSWSASDYNRPRTVQVTEQGARGQVPLAGIQHGIHNHPQEHNPVTFEIGLPWPTRLVVEVSDVSGHGGAGLEISVDGQLKLQKNFSDPDGSTKTDTLRQYAGAYAVDVPIGKHTVKVENTGPDWFLNQFRLVGALRTTKPALDGWGIAGKTTALAWVRRANRTWRNICVLKQELPAAEPSLLRISPLQSGRWDAEIWDTWKGIVQETKPLTVRDDGTAVVPLPAIEKDLAVKLLRQK